MSQRFSGLLHLLNFDRLLIALLPVQPSLQICCRRQGVVRILACDLVFAFLSLFFDKGRQIDQLAISFVEMAKKIWVH